MTVVEKEERVPIPYFLADIKVAEVMDSFIKKKELIDSDKSRLLGKIWQILNILCPDVGSPSLSVSVPSETLIRLGLVLETTVAEITSRRKRKNQTDEPQNRISFRRTKANEITISKTYVSEELRESSLRLDKLMTEEIVLNKEDKMYKMAMNLKIDNLHLHYKDKTWVPKPGQNGENYNWKRVQPAPRDLNRTLALIAEGLKPSCLGNQKLF